MIYQENNSLLLELPIFEKGGSNSQVGVLLLMISGLRSDTILIEIRELFFPKHCLTETKKKDITIILDKRKNIQITFSYFCMKTQNVSTHKCEHMFLWRNKKIINTLV